MYFENNQRLLQSEKKLSMSRSPRRSSPYRAPTAQFGLTEPLKKQDDHTFLKPRRTSPLRIGSKTLDSNRNFNEEYKPRKNSPYRAAYKFQKDY